MDLFAVVCLAGLVAWLIAGVVQNRKNREEPTLNRTDDRARLFVFVLLTGLGIWNVVEGVLVVWWAILIALNVGQIGLFLAGRHPWWLRGYDPTRPIR